jgi:cytochrome b
MDRREGAAVRDIPVWDLPTRAFHWLLVLLVTASLVSGLAGRLTVHFGCGTAILALLLFRIVWGFIGSQTARFSDFIKGPRAVLHHLQYVAGLRQEDPIPGHNPAGGLMVVALLAVLGLQAGTGLFSSDDILVDGPLVPLVAGATVKLASTIHRTGFVLLLAMVAMHLGAIALYRIVKHEDLVRPMITGRKAVDADLDMAPPFFAPLRLAVLTLIWAAGTVALVLLAPQWLIAE